MAENMIASQRPQLPKVVQAGEVNPYKPVDHKSKVKNWLDESCFWDFDPDYWVENFEKSLSEQQLLEIMIMYQEATEKCKLHDHHQLDEDVEIKDTKGESFRDSDCSSISSVECGVVTVSEVTTDSWIEDPETQVDVKLGNHNQDTSNGYSSPGDDGDNKDYSSSDDD